MASQPNHYSTLASSRRRLGFLPSYVTDVDETYRETSLSFATLIMLISTMFMVFLIFLSCFYHNQKTSPLFISPRRHRLPKLVPPALPVDGYLSWVKVCFYLSDEEIINRIGFDSLIFLRFHRLALRCIVKMSVFSFIVLLPLNYSSGGGHANGNDLKEYFGSLFFTDFLRFTMANVQSSSPRLWVHCFAAYLLTAIVIRELLREYEAYTSIRHRYLLSREPHLRTVLVTNIPRHLRSPKRLEAYFRNVSSNAVKDVYMCQNLVHLERLVRTRTNVLSKIEKDLLMLCRTEKKKLYNHSLWRRIMNNFMDSFGVNAGAQERLTRHYATLEEHNKAIEAEQRRRRRVMKKMEELSAGDGAKDIDYVLTTQFGNTIASSYRPPVEMEPSSIDARLRSRSPSGNDVAPVDMDEPDALMKGNNPAKKEKSTLAKARRAIRRYGRIRKDVSFLGKPISNPTEAQDTMEDHINEVTDKAFVVMRTFTAATIAIQSVHSSKPGSMQVSTSPEPRDVLWDNIYMSKGAHRTRSFVGQCLVLLIITFYVVPVAMVSLLVSESALVSSSERLSQLAQASSFFSAVIALVQPLCIVSLQQLLPPLFMAIGTAEGVISFSEVQMRAFSRYFLFQVVNVFLVTTIAGSIFDTIAIILETPKATFEMLGNSLPRMSSFFITFVTMKTFLGIGVELVRTMALLQAAARYVIFPNATLRAKRSSMCGMRAIDDPGWFPFHKILAQDMLITVISVVFAVVAPLVTLPCALFCLCSRIMWTHHHMYVYESVFESGGNFWPKIFRRFVFGLIIAQMTITGQFILKEARHQAYTTIALMVFTYFFLRSTRARYDPTSSALPLELATVMDISLRDDEQDAVESVSPRERSPYGGAYIGQRDPFRMAYLQPALRANCRARPEQPFPVAQLGPEDLMLLNKKGSSESTSTDGGPADSRASVRLKSMNQQDRRLINLWWNDQFQRAGKQNVLSILIGEECGTLTLAVPGDHTIESKHSEDASVQSFV